MALTKARTVWESKKTADEIIRQNLRVGRNNESLKQDVVSMREKIASQVHGQALTDRIKYGSGGMIDIEFSVQYLQLLYAEKHPELLQKAVQPVLQKAVSLSLIDAETATALTEAHQLWILISDVLSLCREDAKASLTEISPATTKLLCDFCAVDGVVALEEKVKLTAKQAALHRLF